jgi:hypothetical protein
MQHIYIVKHDRATVKIYRYTLQIKLHFSEHDIYFVSCRGQLRDLAARGLGDQDRSNPAPESIDCKSFSLRSSSS